MSWIKTISFEDSTGVLKRIYERVKGPDGQIDNILESHSLRPHTLKGHMALYKNVLHHSNNTLPKWYLEAIGVLVSFLNNCQYCVDHHFEGMKKIIDDPERSDKVLEACKTKNFENTFEKAFAAGLVYAEKLTLFPHMLSENDIQNLQQAGLDDGQILEINQVTAYFCYANRTVLGLGVDTAGEVLGLSPNESDDPNNWNHN